MDGIGLGGGWGGRSKGSKVRSVGTRGTILPGDDIGCSGAEVRSYCTEYTAGAQIQYLMCHRERYRQVPSQSTGTACSNGGIRWEHVLHTYYARQEQVTMEYEQQTAIPLE